MDTVRRPYAMLRAWIGKTKRRQTVYAFFVLACLTITYLANQMDRFLLGVVSKRLSRDLQFGSKGCLPTGASGSRVNDSCASQFCLGLDNATWCGLTDACEWTYLGSGIEYQVLAGPAFTVIFTLVAIPLGFSASFRRVNRVFVLAIGAVLWSLMTLLSSFVADFGQLLATRIGLGLFGMASMTGMVSYNEAVCTPYATSILAGYFKEGHRGLALGIYNWGIYIGFSVAFLFEFIVEAVEWRWTFRIAAFLGFLIALVLLVMVLEPRRKTSSQSSKYGCNAFLLKKTLLSFLNPALIALCVAGGVRQGAGLVLAYNIKPLVVDEYCDESVVGQYMSWIPLVGGTLGACLGGYVSDRLRKKSGRYARIWVLVASQFIATPFVVGVVLIPVPYNFLSYLPALVVGEMWIGVCLAVVIEMVPLTVAAAAVAIFLFVINNIGGCVTLLVPPLKAAFGMKYALLILVAGPYAVAGSAFLVIVLGSMVKRKCRRSPSEDVEDEEERAQLLEESQEWSNARLRGHSSPPIPILSAEGAVINDASVNDDSSSDNDDIAESLLRL